MLKGPNNPFCSAKEDAAADEADRKLYETFKDELTGKLNKIVENEGVYSDIFIAINDSGLLIDDLIPFWEQYSKKLTVGQQGLYCEPVRAKLNAEIKIQKLADENQQMLTPFLFGYPPLNPLATSAMLPPATPCTELPQVPAPPLGRLNKLLPIPEQVDVRHLEALQIEEEAYRRALEVEGREKKRRKIDGAGPAGPQIPFWPRNRFEDSHLALARGIQHLVLLGYYDDFILEAVSRMDTVARTRKILAIAREDFVINGEETFTSKRIADIDRKVYLNYMAGLVNSDAETLIEMVQKDGSVVIGEENRTIEVSDEIVSFMSGLETGWAISVLDKASQTAYENGQDDIFKKIEYASVKIFPRKLNGYGDVMDIKDIVNKVPEPGAQVVAGVAASEVVADAQAAGWQGDETAHNSSLGEEIKNELGKLDTPMASPTPSGASTPHVSDDEGKDRGIKQELPEEHSLRKVSPPPTRVRRRRATLPDNHEALAVFHDAGAGPGPVSAVVGKREFDVNEVVANFYHCQEGKNYDRLKGLFVQYTEESFKGGINKISTRGILSPENVEILHEVWDERNSSTKPPSVSKDVSRSAPVPAVVDKREFDFSNVVTTFYNCEEGENYDRLKNLFVHYTEGSFEGGIKQISKLGLLSLEKVEILRKVWEERNSLSKESPAGFANYGDGRGNVWMGGATDGDDPDYPAGLTSDDVAEAADLARQGHAVVIDRSGAKAPTPVDVENEDSYVATMTPEQYKSYSELYKKFDADGVIRLKKIKKLADKKCISTQDIEVGIATTIAGLSVEGRQQFLSTLKNEVKENKDFTVQANAKLRVFFDNADLNGGVQGWLDSKFAKVIQPYEDKVSMIVDAFSIGGIAERFYCSDDIRQDRIISAFDCFSGENQKESLLELLQQSINDPSRRDYPLSYKLLEDLEGFVAEVKFFPGGIEGWLRAAKAKLQPGGAASLGSYAGVAVSGEGGAAAPPSSSYKEQERSPYDNAIEAINAVIMKGGGQEVEDTVLAGIIKSEIPKEKRSGFKDYISKHQSNNYQIQMLIVKFDTSTEGTVDSWLAGVEDRGVDSEVGDGPDVPWAGGRVSPGERGRSTFRSTGRRLSSPSP